MITRRVKMRQRLRKAYLDGGGHDEVLEALGRAESDLPAEGDRRAQSIVAAEGGRTVQSIVAAEGGMRAESGGAENEPARQIEEAGRAETDGPAFGESADERRRAAGR